MIGNNAAAALRKRRNKPAIQIPPGWVAVQEDNGFAIALIYKMHLEAIDSMIVRSKGKCAVKGLFFNVDHSCSPFSIAINGKNALEDMILLYYVAMPLVVHRVIVAEEREKESTFALFF